MRNQDISKKRPLSIRILRVLLKVILCFLIFFVLVVLLIQTSPVQNFVRGKAVTWLEKKLKTRVEVGKIYIGFPKDIVLENVYIEDRSKDTLLSGGKIKLDIALIKLLKSNVEINEVVLENITAKIKRQLPDTAYNFQFIIDAFVSKEKKDPQPKTDTANNFTIRKVVLNKIRLVYKDVITGNDVESRLEHLETKITTFDLAHMRFDVPKLKIEGWDAKIYQSKPLLKSEPQQKDIADAREPVPLRLNVKEVALDKINLDYRNDESALYATIGLDKLLVHPDKLDLINRTLDINDFILQGTTATIRLGKTQEAKIVEKETKQEMKGQTESGWQINIASLKLDRNNLKFDNDNNAPVKNGMDYAHLDATDVNLYLDNFFFAQDSVSGKLKKASFKEKAGLDLQNLQTDFVYGIHGASLNNLYIKTPGTELLRNASVQYASLESIKKDMGNMELNISLRQSKVLVKDVLLFAPTLRSQPAFANPNATWYITSDIHGRLNELKIDELKISGLSNTKINIDGTLAGIPDSKKLTANLVIHSLQSSKKDILLFVPAKSLPQNISFPDQFNLTGTVKGSTKDFATKLLLQTNMGQASVNGSGKNITDKKRAAYNAILETKDLDIGTILQKKDLLGAVTASFSVKGKGLDKTTADATISGIVHSAVVKQYNYRELKMNGSIANQQVKVNAAIIDPNIHLSIDAAADLAATDPAVQLHTVIDSIKTMPLHFTADNIIYRGTIDADFPVLNPDSLTGKLYITNSLLLKDDKRINMDTVQLFAGRNDSGQYINLNSDVVNASLHGQYKITELGKIFQQSIQPYFSVDSSDFSTNRTPYDFVLTAEIINKPVLAALIPGLQRMDSINLVSHFSNDKGWNASLTAPVIDIGENHIRNLVINAGTTENALDVKADVKQLTIGKSVALYNTSIDALVKDNKIDFNLDIKDKASKDKYKLAGLFEQPQKGDYHFSIKPDSLLLNYDSWTISPENKIEIGKASIAANNFNLEKEGQQLKINTIAQNTDSALQVDFTNFKLETLTGFVQADSTLIGGVLNGNAIVSGLPKDPVFTSDLTITDLNIMNDTAGNVKMLVNNKTKNTFTADITITGRGNDVSLKGDYHTKQPDNNFDFLLDLKNLPLTTVQAFSQGAIRQSSGNMNGKFTVKGNTKQPKVNGDLNFAQAAFIPSQLSTRFIIDNEKIQVNDEGIVFNRFSIKDSSANELTLNGKAATNNFTNYNFDFTVRADNFQALNSTKKDNKLFYGQLYFNTNLRVKGTELAPVIDGRLTVNDKTKLTIVLPQKEPGVAEREGVIEFVDMDAPVNDTLFLKNYDSLNTLILKGIDLTANIEIKKEAELNLIVDEGNGDFLNVRGEALLTAGVDPSGKITLAGSYELEDGAYQLTFNLLRRKFNIQKGSKIVWGGEPTEADVNISAAYETNTAPLDLVKNQLGEVSGTERNTYLQKLPFQVFLKMTGKLLQPQIAFDVVLPDNKEYNVSPAIVATVRNKLEMLRQDEGEMNKQVFALLLLNRFVGENPFNSSGGGTNAETLVRQSVSKLLTEQLNRLAENLVQGVDLNFDIASSDDYTTGERQERTDLNVGISKKLLNDRLTVTVGSNFELESPQNSGQNRNNIAGNVALNYRLSKDGRYLLRAYRKNEYQGVLDGYIIETGVGFIITIDYNKFSQIFKKKKTRQPPKQEEQTDKSQPTVKSNTDN